MPFMIDKIQFILNKLIQNDSDYTAIWFKAVIIATIEFTIYNKNIVNSIAVINIQAIMA